MECANSAIVYLLPHSHFTSLIPFYCYSLVICVIINYHKLFGYYARLNYSILYAHNCNEKICNLINQIEINCLSEYPESSVALVHVSSSQSNLTELCQLEFKRRICGLFLMFRHFDFNFRKLSISVWCLVNS